MSRSHVKVFIKYIIINIINYNYAQHFEIAIDNTFVRNLPKSFNFEIRFEIMLRNASSKSFRRNRNFEL